MEIMSEREFVEGFDRALNNGTIRAYFQGQFNHSTGRMVGAEALMRWVDPVKGIQSPASFIPAFEENGLITRADLFIVNEACRFIRRCMDSGLAAIPISINLSRYDIIQPNLVHLIEETRKKYNIHPRYLHIEITESSAIGGLELMKSVIDRLHELGYFVEMDDFGSGYSSLNILKDLDVDKIKLDMKFLENKKNGREGIIISSVIQMAKWLETPVIAEGVETITQADYLKSLGCNYMQGYLYAKPISEEEFIVKVKELQHEPIFNAAILEQFNSEDFWNSESSGTLLFNNYMGPACIYTYENGKVNLIKVNSKCAVEIGNTLSEYDLIHMDVLATMSEEDQNRYIQAIEEAIRTNAEVKVQTWRKMVSKCCGEDQICIQSYIQPLGYNGKQFMLLCRIHNVTTEVNNFLRVSHNETLLRNAAEHVNEYAWEYDIYTHDMKPCSRCMRDLGLPPVLKNYPKSAYETGVFPPEVWEMYDEMIAKVEAGVSPIEAIIPLTMNRIPFHVRYTVEYDESGRPLKAYGSAALVVDK